MSPPAEPAAPAVTSRHVAKGVGTTLIARLSGVIDVVAQPLYVWMFGLPSYGLYAVLWAAVNLVENIADLGMTSAMQRTVPQAASDAQATGALRAAMLIGLTPCILIAAAASLAAHRLAPLINVAAKDEAHVATAIMLFAWALPLWAFVEISTSALRARRLFGAEIRLRLLWEQVIRLMLAVVLHAAGMSVMGLFVAHLVSLTITAVLCVRLVARHYDLTLLFRGPLFEPIFAETAKAGLAVLPANTVARLFGDSPPLILNLLLPGAAGATAAALYGIARKISSVVQLIRTAFAYVLAPLASAAIRDDPRSVRALYGFTTRLTLAIVVPLAVVLAASAPAILRLFGRDAAVALPALVLLIAARMVEAVSGSAVPIQQVTSSYSRQLVASIVGLAAAAVLGLLLVPRYGLVGMAAATGTGFIVASVIPLWQLHRFDDLHPFAPPFAAVAARVVAIALAGLAAALAIGRLPDAVQLPLLVATMHATIWASCRHALPAQDRAALGGTGRRLRLA